MILDDHLGQLAGLLVLQLLDGRFRNGDLSLVRQDQARGDVLGEIALLHVLNVRALRSGSLSGLTRTNLAGLSLPSRTSLSGRNGLARTNLSRLARNGTGSSVAIDGAFRRPIVGLARLKRRVGLIGAGNFLSEQRRGAQSAKRGERK
jgi:hypothetical protein